VVFCVFWFNKDKKAFSAAMMFCGSAIVSDATSALVTFICVCVLC
jgi:hypothetical protein